MNLRKKGYKILFLHVEKFKSLQILNFAELTD